MKISAEFVTSAADAAGLPREGLAEVALVGRSNVGKSSLINALVRQRLARTSAEPGKTRLVNVYRVTRPGGPFYLVDLPGYGYARAPRQGLGGPGGVESRRQAAAEFEALVGGYFGAGRMGQVAALLLVDIRHPGLESDMSAWRWLANRGGPRAIVATKVDKLARGQRIRAMRQLESVFDDSVLPVSAVTGEGLDELWKLIDRLANRHKSNPQPNSSRPDSPKGNTAAMGLPPAHKAETPRAPRTQAPRGNRRPRR